MSNDPEQSELVKSYWRQRATLSRALVGLLGSVVAAIVLRNHTAWGDGQLAYFVFAAAHVVGAICAVVSFRANGFMHEARGHHIGKFGVPPPATSSAE